MDTLTRLLTFAAYGTACGSLAAAAGYFIHLVGPGPVALFVLAAAMVDVFAFQLRALGERAGEDSEWAGARVDVN